ncbi:uncharacterized protein PHALS_04092 [Plasmopara halstedii]|uniref:Uncharacterized protein n=1 Tax=Plasmopara halstedii TaxID=4781 RepID=A0A0P1A8V7_PLAHL|nr:uncharacterized protein PHALS_04092 [Plasmopara halstedii]CEG36837.1 hypothetical protein PHALS_04092 [Plasmopara halstedii]|eukprot:XP_024573206.1 hypothetical protein PHALS_04092 [Plasmopara halstedii]
MAYKITRLILRDPIVVLKVQAQNPLKMWEEISKFIEPAQLVVLMPSLPMLL